MEVIGLIIKIEEGMTGKEIYDQLMELFTKWYKSMNDELKKEGEKSNYLGGIGDKRRTMHESIFSFLFPQYQEQVTFGTKFGGFKKYGTTKYTVDFYDPINKWIVEIDGESHKKTDISIIYDGLRDLFFKEVYGLETVRYSNKDVEEILLYHINKQLEKGNHETLVNIIANHFQTNCEYWRRLEVNKQQHKNNVFRIFNEKTIPQ